MDRRINNPKIKNLTPEWADFKGFSFLFDNPGPAQNLEKEEEHLYKLAADDTIPFYHAIQETLVDLGKESLLSSFSLCLLPLSSYHVTYLDGLNDKNKTQLDQELQPSFQAFADQLPLSLLGKNRFTHFQENPLQDIAIEPLVFEYRDLANWRNKALAITLKPSSSSRENYRRLLIERRILFEQYLASMGLEKVINFNLEKLNGCIPPNIYQAIEKKVQTSQPSFETLSNLSDFLASILGTQEAKLVLPVVYEKLTDFTPHISLGYFAHTDGGRLASEHTTDWSAIFKQKLSGKTLAFDSYSLFGFLNMAEYMKAEKGTI